MSRKNCEITFETRKIILKLYCEGNSLRAIGKIIGKSHSSVQRVIQNYTETGTLEPRSRSGRPKKLDIRHKREIIRKVKVDPTLSAPKIASGIQKDYNISVSAQTVRNILHEANLYGRVARRKPYISKVNRKKRYLFAKEYSNKPQEFWNRVLLTDESKFNIYKSDGRTMVWREPNKEFLKKNIQPTVKHGGRSVMVWGCMAANGVGNLHFIETTMDKYVYIEVLKKNLPESVEKLGLSNNYIFQQDNDPKYQAHVSRLWLLYNVPKQLHTPPQSPDLNPIEHLWDLLDRRIRKHTITSISTLRDTLQEEWNKITAEDTANLVNTMHKRIEAVKKSERISDKILTISLGRGQIMY